jgi:hypothetical protein
MPIELAWELSDLNREYAKVEGHLWGFRNVDVGFCMPPGHVTSKRRLGCPLKRIFRDK